MQVLALLGGRVFTERAAVDLYALDWQTVKVAQRTVFRAKVIQPDFYAQVVQRSAQCRCLAGVSSRSSS